MMHFPVSGVEVNPLLPLLVAFAVSALTAPAGVSGAFLLLPFQVSVLGFTSPAVSPTNLVYNSFATPGGRLPLRQRGAGGVAACVDGDPRHSAGRFRGCAPQGNGALRPESLQGVRGARAAVLRRSLALRGLRASA